MSQRKKGNQCHSGMKGHIGVDAGTESMHSVTATTASVHHLDHSARLVRVEDKSVVAGSGHQAAKSPRAPGRDG